MQIYRLRPGYRASFVLVQESQPLTCAPGKVRVPGGAVFNGSLTAL